MPSDEQVSRKIEQLEQERDELRQAENRGAGSPADNAARAEEIRVELDQVWDLQRRRRALREAGRNPDEAEERSIGTVEGYWQ